MYLHLTPCTHARTHTYTQVCHSHGYSFEEIQIAVQKSSEKKCTPLQYLQMEWSRIVRYVARGRIVRYVAQDRVGSHSQVRSAGQRGVAWSGT